MKFGQCSSREEILLCFDKLNARLDTIEETQRSIKQNQLVAKITVSVLMGVFLVAAWFIDQANLLSDLFKGHKDQG